MCSYCWIELNRIIAALSHSRSCLAISTLESDLTSIRLYLELSGKTHRALGQHGYLYRIRPWCLETARYHLLTLSTLFVMWVLSFMALYVLYIPPSFGIQTVFAEVSSVCCAFGVAKFPKIIAWWFPSPPAASCFSTASIRCVVLTISSADLQHEHSIGLTDSIGIVGKVTYLVVP